MLTRTRPFDLAMTLSPSLAISYRYHHGTGKQDTLTGDTKIFSLMESKTDLDTLMQTFTEDMSFETFEQTMTVLQSFHPRYPIPMHSALFDLFCTLDETTNPSARATCARFNWLCQQPGHFRKSYHNNKTWRYYYYADYDILIQLLQQDRMLDLPHFLSLLSAPALVKVPLLRLLQDLAPNAEQMGSNAALLLRCAEQPFAHNDLHNPALSGYIHYHFSTLGFHQKEQLVLRYTSIPFNYAPSILQAYHHYSPYIPEIGYGSIESLAAMPSVMKWRVTPRSNPHMTDIYAQWHVHWNAMLTQEPKVRQLFMCYRHLRQYVPDAFEEEMAFIAQSYETYCAVLGVQNLSFAQTFHEFLNSTHGSSLSETQLLF